MKKAAVVVFAVLVFSICCVSAHAAPLGDVDGDGGITSGDARLTLRAAVGLEPDILPGTEAFTAADADFSGQISAADARSVLRAAVKLEDLSDRLPESEALSEEALFEKITNCFILDMIYGDCDGGSCRAIPIEGDGTVLVPYDKIHKVTSFFPSQERRVESILFADPVSGLALLKVSGKLRPLSVNRTWYDVGDTVYTVDSGGCLLSMKIIPPPSDPESEIPEHAICAQVSKTSCDYDVLDLQYYPVVDRFGRAVAMIMNRCYPDGESIAYAMPLSLLPAPEDYTPRSLEEFSRDEWRVTLKCPVERVDLLKGGVGLFPVYAQNRESENVMVKNPQYDLLRVSVIEDPHDKESLILVIVAKRPCENVPVTIRITGMYETSEIKLPVSVTQEGYVNMVGMEILPDPGVIWDKTPTDFYVEANRYYSFEYEKCYLRYSDEELFYSYAGALLAMGYEFVERIGGGYENQYKFRQEEYGVTVNYWDTEERIKIVCTFE